MFGKVPLHHTTVTLDNSLNELLSVSGDIFQVNKTKLLFSVSTLNCVGNGGPSKVIILINTL